MKSIITSLPQLKSKSALFILIFLFAGILTPLKSGAQVNIALSATANHTVGGSGVYGPAEYNNNLIQAQIGCASGSSTTWGWCNTNGFISFTWGTPQTFDKVVIYKGD